MSPWLVGLIVYVVLFGSMCGIVWVIAKLFEVVHNWLENGK